MSTSTKVWFITGANSGFGRQWATAALQRGDKVAAAVRNPESVDDLADQFTNSILPIQLDVTDRQAAFAAIARAHQVFGRLDIVVNNAGYGAIGTIEEISEAEIRRQFDTNVLGPIWVIQAVLPVLRDQRFGHILNVSSQGGVFTLPYSGAYCASKWALEGLSDSLAKDLKALGIHITLIEPGHYPTRFESSARRSDPHPAYEQARADLGEALRRAPQGRIEATAEAILTVVDSDHPPLRIFLGDILPQATADYEYRLAEWQAWQPVSVAAQG